jgi:hypothetical protein
MQAYRIEKVVPPSGKIELDGLPFAAGAVVEIIVIDREGVTDGRRARLLKNSVIKYEDPFEPLAENEWGVLQ